jgi:methanogenic corrinoid protein MtbC1
MIRWCSYCQRYLGDVAPFGDFALTHGICQACAVRFEAAEQFENSTPLVAFYRKLQRAGQGGELPSASAVLDEGISLGLRPLDLLIGLVQPALYHVGKMWAEGATPVACEHAFTAMASSLVALVTVKYPEAQAYRQSRSPHILLVAADGNYHTLGVQLVELMLVLEQVPTFSVYPGIAADEVLDLWKVLPAPVVGFSIALPSQLPGVRKAVERFLRECPQPPRFLLGGAPVREGLDIDPTLPIELVADPLSVMSLLRTH